MNSEISWNLSPVLKIMQLVSYRKQACFLLHKTVPKIIFQINEVLAKN